MTSIDDVKINAQLVIDNLNFIYDYAQTNQVHTLIDLKQVFPDEIIEACCKVVSINTGKKRARIEEAKKQNKQENNKKSQKVMHKCYVCRSNVVDRSKSHFCDNCKDINKSKRTITAHLDDKIAIVTGGRVKIGFETAIRLLECNCTVIVTTRFVADAIDRFSKHPKYETFKSKLIIYPLDLRRKTHIDNFCNFMYKNFSKLDILINNAAQTIRRPKEFFEHLIKGEQEYSKLLGDIEKTTESNQLISVKHDESSLVLQNTYSDHLFQVFNSLKSEDGSFFPPGKYDGNGEQIDLRTTNTWIKELGEIDTEECVECMTINALAPFHLNQCLKQLLRNANGAYIVNVSSMEGIFNMRNKTANHPHTNMAKSALNMMTRTSAKSYARDKIYMVGVDTGWITNEFPNEYESRSIKQTDDVPLDNIDGACRVLDPVFEYYNTGKTTYGVFLKDYVVSEW
jgi:NAD(P)-dependent dehydrogenase (short-subunit alcohol dehydrogenase family)